ncbi:MAG: C-terminal binding protein [Chloroflexia bacterium]|nr:C-terminal binding protein [Chloroflexia bacterium]
MPAGSFRAVITSDRYGDADADYTLERSALARFPDLTVELVGHQARAEDELIAAAAGADVLLVSTREAINARVLSAIPSVKVISRYGVGLDNIDLDAATANGIVVTHYPGYCTSEVADHAFALILALNRRIVELDRDLHDGAWADHQATTTAILRGPVRPLGEMTLGIVGFGRIGQSVAQRARPFGLDIIASDPYLPPESFAALGVEGMELDALLGRADIITVHCPLTPETRGLIDAQQLAHVKPDAVIVNTARGPIIDLLALVDALTSGRLAGAALDVVDPEPLPLDHPLYTLPNVILTPHAAYYSERSVETVRIETLAEALTVLAGRSPRTVANPLVLDRVNRAGIASTPAASTE